MCHHTVHIEAAGIFVSPADEISISDPFDPLEPAGTELHHSVCTLIPKHRIMVVTGRRE
jgi:hypothetical protein